MRNLLLLHLSCALFCAAFAADQLEPLLEDLLGRKQYVAVPPEQFGIDMPTDKPPCDESADSLAEKLDEVVPENYRNDQQIEYALMRIKLQLQYCQQHINQGMYMNLRTAILAGLFSGKIELLEVPHAIQAQCLVAIYEEELQCNDMKQSVCNIVNPLNLDAVPFGSQDLKDFAIKYDNVADVTTVCGAMSAIIEDPTALENSIPMQHNAKNAIRNGIATTYIDSINRLAASGDLEKQRSGRRRKGRRMHRQRRRFYLLK